MKLVERTFTLCIYYFPVLTGYTCIDLCVFFRVLWVSALLKLFQGELRALPNLAGVANGKQNSVTGIRIGIRI